MNRPVLWCIALAVVLATAVGCGRVNPARRGLWSAVEAKREQLNQCYEQVVARNPSVAGSMVMWLEVSDDNGQVTSVEVENSGVPDESLAPCVTGALQEIRLAEPPPIAMRVQYTFQFRVASAAPPPPVTTGPGQPPPPTVPAGNQPPPPAVPANDRRPPPPPAVPAGG